MYTIYNIIPLFKKENVHYLLYNSSIQKKKEKCTLFII